MVTKIRPTIAKVKKNIYLGNPQLKKIGVPVAMSQDDIQNIRSVRLIQFTLHRIT